MYLYVLHVFTCIYKYRKYHEDNNPFLYCRSNQWSLNIGKGQNINNGQLTLSQQQNFRLFQT